MSDSGKGDRSRLRLIPLAAVMPQLSRAAASPRPGAAADIDHRRAAEGLVELCAQVLRGRHPVAAVRNIASTAAFGQFSALYRRLTARRRTDAPVTLRLSTSAAGPDGSIDIVAIVEEGRRARAVMMRASRAPRAGWQLTQCQLVGRYLTHDTDLPARDLRGAARPARFGQAPGRAGARGDTRPARVVHRR